MAATPLPHLTVKARSWTSVGREELTMSQTNCPKCGFAYRWDDVTCGHCH
jgi:ribosomal protein S27AE